MSSGGRTRRWVGAPVAIVAAATIGAVAAGAGGAGTAAAPSPPQTVKAKDGGLVVTVPRGALRKPAKIRVRVLTRAQYPPELRNATFKPGSKLYALEPAGLRFLKPVTVTRRIDAKAQGFDLGKEIPGIVLTVRDGKGSWEVLAGQTVRPSGSTLLVSGTTRHFSTIVAFDGAARLSLDPTAVEVGVGDVFKAKVVSSIDNTRRSDPVSVDSTTWLADESTVVRVDPTVNTGNFRCERAGTGSYGAKVVIVEESLAVSVGGLFGSHPYTETFYLSGIATCRTGAPAGVQLTGACVIVVHSPLGPSPSYLRFVMSFGATGLPPSPRAELTVGGVNGGSAVSGAIGADGKVELRGGITSYGGKQVQKLVAGGQDVTQQLIAKIGQSVNVTSAQGTAAGQCP